jgi:hypothetical protein
LTNKGTGDAMAGNAVEDFVAATARRLAADGCEVRKEDWGGQRVVVGYRGDFRVQWFATRLHLFTVVAATPRVTAEALERFTNTVLDYALARKGEMRGFQSGVAAFPCLVSGDVDPAAVAWARQKQRLRFACIGRPVAVDPERGVIGVYRGTPMLGVVYAGHLRRKLDTYFALPNAQRATAAG